MTTARQVTLTGTDGSVWDLTDPTAPVVAAPDQILWGAPPSTVAEQTVIGVQGVRRGAARHLPRDIVIPVVVRAGGDRSQIDETLRRLAVATNPLDGNVAVTVVDPDGRSRTIDAHAVTGGGIGLRSDAARSASTALVLRAAYPYWRDTDATAIVIDPPQTAWDSGDATLWSSDLSWSPPIPWGGVSTSTVEWSPALPWSASLPWSGAASETVRIKLTNDGDVQAWPRWEIDGPATVVSAANITTGATWRIDVPLVAGDRLVIETRPGIAGVRLNGELAGSLLDATRRDLWGLPRGVSTVVVQMTGRSGSSGITASYSPEFLTC